MLELILIKEVIHYSRKNNSGVELKIISIKGVKSYKFDNESKDRLFLIRLIKGDFSIEYPITFEEQLILLDLIISNKILDYAFKIYLNKVKNKLDSMELERKIKNAIN